MEYSPDRVTVTGPQRSSPFADEAGATAGARDGGARVQDPGGRIRAGGARGGRRRGIPALLGRRRRQGHALRVQGAYNVVAM